MTQPFPRERAFAEHLRSLAAREDGDARAALAALRRGLGKQPGEVAEVARHVMPWVLADDGPDAVDAYFRVAALFATHRIPWSASDPTYLTNLGASFSRLRGNDDNPGAERRFVALLNAHPDEVDRHLRHAISLLASKGIPVDWAQLLRDLQEWSYERRPVQLAWARAYWGSVRRDDGQLPAVDDAAPSPRPADPAPVQPPLA